MVNILQSAVVTLGCIVLMLMFVVMGLHLIGKIRELWHDEFGRKK